VTFIDAEGYFVILVGLHLDFILFPFLASSAQFIDQFKNNS
jgi:hypothetical protein